MLKSFKMGRSYYILLVMTLFLYVGTSHQFSVQGLSSETSSAEVYTSEGDHDGIWKSEQDAIKEDKEPFLKLQQTDNDDQVYRDKDILVNELDTEYEKKNAKKANEGGIGQDEDQSDVEVEEDKHITTKKEGRIQENENSDTEIVENKGNIADEEDEDILGTEGDINIDQDSYENGGNARAEEDDGDSQMEENEENEIEGEQEIEDEDKIEVEMEAYKHKCGDERDAVAIEKEEEKGISAEDDDSHEIEFSVVENYFDTGITELDSAVISELQSENSDKLVQEERENNSFNEMVENEQHTCNSKRSNLKMKKLRRKQRRSKDKQRSSKQGKNTDAVRRNKNRRKKSKKKQRRNKYKKTKITKKQNNQVTFFRNILQLSSTAANICEEKSKSSDFTKSISVGGVTFVTKLGKTKRGKCFLSAKGKGKLSFKKLVQAFHASLLPRLLSRFLWKIPFLRLSIYNPKISHVFGTKPPQLHIGGHPSIHDFKIVNMDIIVLRKNRKFQVISGFEIGEVNFAWLLSQITGFNFKHFFILNQNVLPSVIVSPVTLPKVHFDLGRLVSLPIKKGITIKASLKFPRNCKSDKFCTFVKILVGFNPVLSLSATIQSAIYYSITASLHSLNLGRGVRLRKAGLEIIGGASSRIGLVGEVKLRKPNLLFAGRISIGTKGLILQLSMKNCWHKAFGAEWLDICNLLGAINFAPPTGIRGLALGGQIHLGYRSTGRQLRAKAYIGFSMVNPIQNYYYAKFSRLTMRSLLRAFRINWKVPRPLGNSGFPNGFMSSFSFLGKELPEVGLSIPRGLRIKGTLNILGLRSHADITIDLPRLLDINVALPPIKIGRIFSMYASSRDKKRGPYLKAKLSFYQRRVNIEAKGYLNVLGVSFSTALKITNSYYSFSFKQKLFDLFWASVYMRASYGNIRRAHFHIRGSFGVDLFRGIQNIAKHLIRNFSNIANKAVSVAKKVFNKYRNLERRAQNTLLGLYRKLQFWKRKLFVAEIVEVALEYPEERKVHIHVLSWRRLQRIARRVGQRARHFVRKVGQGARRLVKRVGQHTRQISKRVGGRVLHVIKRINYHAKRLYNSAKREISKVKRKLKRISHWLKWARNHLNSIRHIYKRGINMFNYIRRHGLSRIIRVREVTFSASLGRASTGKFSCGIFVEILGKMIHIRASINLRQLKNIGMKIFHLIKSLF